MICGAYEHKNFDIKALYHTIQQKHQNSINLVIIFPCWKLGKIKCFNFFKHIFYQFMCFDDFHKLRISKRLAILVRIFKWNLFLQNLWWWSFDGEIYFYWILEKVIIYPVTRVTWKYDGCQVEHVSCSSIKFWATSDLSTSLSNELWNRIQNLWTIG